jgi:hypothetical protein
MTKELRLAKTGNELRPKPFHYATPPNNPFAQMRSAISTPVPPGKTLTTIGTLVNDGETLLYIASVRDCVRCPLKGAMLSQTQFPPDPAQYL